MIGLRAKLVGVVAALLIVLAGAAWVIVVRAEREVTRSRDAGRDALIAQVAGQLGYPVLARSTPLIQPILDPLGDNVELRALRVRDDKGAILVELEGPAAGERGPGRDVTQPIVARGAPGDDDGELEAFGIAGGAPREVGVLEVTFSEAAATRARRAVRRQLLLVFALVGGAGVLLLVAGVGAVVRRTRALAAAAARVARGDLTVRVGGADGEGGDELAALARDFDAMTVALGEQRARLDDASQALAEREALAAIGRATAVIAHELKNPLGIVLGAADIVADPARGDVARGQAARIIGDEVRRLDRTLTGLLDHARPRAPTRTRHDALALARAAVTRATGAGGPADGLAVDVVGDPAWVLVDEAHAAQVLLNLLTNAAQAGARRVSVAVSTLGTRVRIEVADDGPGVPADVRARLFQPFVTTKQRGSGLGLAASRRITRDNGGDLVLDPAGPGARFQLELALAPPKDDP